MKKIILWREEIAKRNDIPPNKVFHAKHLKIILKIINDKSLKSLIGFSLKYKSIYKRLRMIIFVWSIYIILSLAISLIARKISKNIYMKRFVFSIVFSVVSFGLLFLDQIIFLL